MRNHFPIVSLSLFLFSIFCSCKTKDILPDEVSDEIKVSCYLTDCIDTTSSKEVWTDCVIHSCSMGYIKINFIGICWNSNNDTLPTIESESIKEYYHGVICVWEGHDYEFKFGCCESIPVRQGIPVSESDTKLIIRGFFIFNDTLIRYSDPLVLNNPIDYAN
jgi:hypothetical protein